MEMWGADLAAAVKVAAPVIFLVSESYNPSE